MANIDITRPIVEGFEGGFQNYKTDKMNYTKDGTLVGTNKGVSANLYESLFGVTPTVDDLMNITDEQIDQVFETFAKAICFDDINNQNIANIWFDWVWASGGYYPNEHVQKILDVTVDGIVGSGTIDALNNFPDQEDLFNQIKQARFDYIDSVIAENPSDAEYKDDWVGRVNAYTYSNAA